jgi:hypothetical protein
MAKARSARSFSVTADSGSTAFGTLTLTVGELIRRPGTAYRQTRCRGFRPKPHFAVVEKQLGPRLDSLEDLGCGSGASRFVLLAADRGRDERSAGSEPDSTFGECAEAQFRSLQIGQNADRSPGRALNRSDRREACSVVLMSAVAEIQPEDINPGLEQGAYLLGRGGRRAEGRNDFGAAPAPHAHLPTGWTLELPGTRRHPACSVGSPPRAAKAAFVIVAAAALQ